MKGNSSVFSERTFKEIVERYDLGKITEFKALKGGVVNHNFLVKTNKGRFIVRFLRKNPKESYLKSREAEFALLYFLRKEKFQYVTPNPLKDKNNEYLSSIGGRHVWVYERLIGKPAKIININKIKQIAKALAQYHESVKKFEWKGEIRKNIESDWIQSDYNLMKKKMPKTDLDKTMLDNLPFFQKLLSKVLTISFEGKMLPIHGDFHQGNILFSKGVLNGIIDFDNLSLSLKSQDIALSMRNTCVRKKKLNLDLVKTYLKEYRKYSKLAKKEAKLILPLLIRNYCMLFRWSYMGEMKDEELRLRRLNKNVMKTKDLIEKQEELSKILSM